MGDDRELLDQWRAGDRAAGSELFRRHFLSVTGFLQRRAPSCAVDDLVQSTFERCVASNTRIRDGLRIRAYLLMIARNELLMYLRSRKNQPHEAPVEVEDPDRASWLANYRAEQRLLLFALRRLPDDLQLAVELRYWEDLSLAEIAEIVDAPLNTIKTRLLRARNRLAKEIEKLEAEPDVRESTLSGIEHWVASIRGRDAQPSNP
ncbi:MAG: RNA polymerase sigma factor [Deltaproteobacteria bacterium]|nr:RNA polymerase sigma factor [Deltaproteobacteria bacterium]